VTRIGNQAASGADGMVITTVWHAAGIDGSQGIFVGFLGALAFLAFLVILLWLDYRKVCAELDRYRSNR
jgi:hypothetical protein